MSKFHFKSNPTYSNPISLNVDREKGIINNVCIAYHGENKNGSYFNDQFLEDLVSQGNKQTQGVKSRFGHPNMCATSLGTYVGRYKGFRSNERKVYANLHLDEITKKTQVEGKGISMFEYIMDMAETNPDMFGNSIVISADYFEEFDTDGKLVHEYSIKLESFVASDLVDDPAATDSLFSGSSDLGVIITQFLDENEEIFEAITKNPKVIEDFLDRYSTYATKYKIDLNMSFLDKFKKKIGVKETFDIDETLADGSIVTVKTDNETPQVGDAVVDSEGAAVPDGDHVTKDGSTIVTVGGLITEIKDAEEETEGDDEPTNAEIMQSVNNLSKDFKAFQKQYKTDLKENQDAIVLSHKDLNQKFSNLSKTVKSNSPDYVAGDKKKKNSQQSASGYDPDKVREAREARKTPNTK